MADETQALLDLERRRGDAIGTGDLDALAGVLDDSYVHVLAPGTLRDKAGYLEMIRVSPRRPIRGELTVRVFGDAAVMTGELTNNIGPADAVRRVIPAFCTQVAAKGADGRWRFVSYILTQRKDQMT